MKKLSLFFCLLVFLVSCGNEIDYSATYTSDKFETGDVRLFTKNGEIKNSSTISSFLSRHKGRYFESSSMTNSYLQSSVTLQFLSATDAKLTYGNVQLLTVITKSNLIYLESKDTTYTGQRYYDYPGASESIYNAMLKYSPLYNDTVLLANSDYNYFIRTKQCFYMTQSGNELKMPFMSYYYHEPYGEHSGTFINNCFNVDCIKLMASNDTLAIQQAQLVLKKK
ncbi:MAG TPA: hypothetical protein VI413_06070 [Paludibacter sp.]